MRRRRRKRRKGLKPQCHDEVGNCEKFGGRITVLTALMNSRHAIASTSNVNLSATKFIPSLH